MSKWKCLNKDCILYDKERISYHDKIGFDSNGVKYNSSEKCPECGEKCEDVSEKWDGGSFNTYGHNVCSK